MEFTISFMGLVMLFEITYEMNKVTIRDKIPTTFVKISARIVSAFAD